MGVEVFHGDSREVLKTLEESSIDSCCTDPPYALVSIVKRFGKQGSTPAKSDGASGVYQRASAGFMGQAWDTGETAFDPAFWAEVFRVLKPGAHVLAMGGTRTYHRLACAIEDAGFEIRDCVSWIYGSGFCKSHNLKNKPICDCDESENAVPYDHAQQTPEHNLRPLRKTDLSPSVDAVGQCRQVLLESLQKQGSQEHGAPRAESETGGEEQSNVEGRPVHRAGQGLCDGSEALSPESAEERICLRTHHSRGNYVGSATDAGRRSPSPQPEPCRQSAGEPEGLCVPSRTLDGGTLSGRGACPRCGKLRKEFEGFGTALKPAQELIVMARKPLGGTVAANVMEHGTGALNIDGCRVHGEDAQAGEYTVKRLKPGATLNKTGGNWRPDDSDAKEFHGEMKLGRWPANVVHDGSEEVLSAFPQTDGQGGGVRGNEPSDCHSGVYSGPRNRLPFPNKGDTGSAARFFYCAKADKDDRLGSKHPTVKPVDLMRWLVRLVTPPAGTVLDPFAGSGTTGMAAMAEGMSAILIEREARFVEDIRRRIDHVSGADAPLFSKVAAE